MIIIKGRTLVEGEVQGLSLISLEPISFYGGVDAERGIVTEKGHPLEGKSIANRILFFPYGKGSTVGSYVIYRLAKKGLAPKAIVNVKSEPILIIGCILGSITLVDNISFNLLKEIKNDVNVKIIAKKKEAIIVIEQ